MLAWAGRRYGVKLAPAGAFEIGGSMRSITVGLALAASLLLAAAEVRADGAMTVEQRQAESDGLSWITEPGDYALPLSHSHITLPQNYALLVGADAARYDELWNGVASPNTEAIVFSQANNSIAYYIFEDSGHVAEDDWSEVDAEDFLAQIRATDAEGNAQRQQAGLPLYYTGEWHERPHFDAATKTAYWAYDVRSDPDRWMNATALRLAREGYHRVIWVGGLEQFQTATGSLDALLAMHDYDEGYRYTDYVEGDRLAGYGIGALAAAVLGVKLGKTGFAAILAGILLFGKKFGVVILAAIGGITAWVRRKHRN